MNNPRPMASAKGTETAVIVLMAFLFDAKISDVSAAAAQKTSLGMVFGWFWESLGMV